MTTTPNPPSERAQASEEGASTLAVAAAVLYVDDDGIDAVLERVDAQNHQPVASVVVGGGDDGRAAAERHDATYAETLREYVADLGPDIDLVWVLHGDALPRPDALRWLVAELERNDASLVGSKILSADEPDRLESVGSATDVYGEPYSGLDPGEVDLEQYDVVRDVAFVSAVSVLVRRDLLRGLRGLDRRLPPVAAGLDLSQRARIAGGRVMVAPASEVLHAGRCGHGVDGWRERAGRMRAMLKAYRPITLAWLIPMATLIGLADGIGRLLTGQPGPLWDLIRATAWNVVQLPSTVVARRYLAPVRAVGDEELFRYQVQGSVRLRAFGSEVAERLGWTIDEEPAVVTEEDMGMEVRRTGPVVAALVLAALAIASRQLWFGEPPAVGFSLPLPDDPLSVLGSFAGGWNPAGLGSPGPFHPAPAAVAALQLAVGSWAQPLWAILSGVAGVLGVARLLSRQGVAGPSRYLAGLVLILGPFGLMLAEATSWSGLMAVGGLPWLVEATLAGWPAGWRSRIQRVGVMALTAVFAAFAPLIGLTVLAAVLLAWPLLRTGWGAVPRAVLAAGFTAVVAGAYLLGAPPEAMTAAGPDLAAFPPPLLTGFVLAAAVAAIVSAPAPQWRVAAWGGASMAAALAGIVLVPDGGGELGTAAALLGSLGAAAVVGAALSFDADARRTVLAVRGIGSALAVVAVAATLLVAPAGRAGLPADAWEDRLEFVGSLAPPTGPGRVLVAGLPESMPGEYRIASGYAYRLVWGERPTLDQAWLPEPALGEAALAQALAEIERGDRVRPGARLAEFAIRWIVVLDQVPLQQALQAQVDLAEIPVQPGVAVYENLAARPRAEATGAGSWVASRADAAGPEAADGTVRWADNASPRWGPEWTQDGWANRVSAELGTLTYRHDPLLRAAAVAGGAVVVLGAVAVIGGRRWRR